MIAPRSPCATACGSSRVSPRPITIWRSFSGFARAILRRLPRRSTKPCGRSAMTMRSGPPRLPSSKARAMPAPPTTASHRGPSAPRHRPYCSCGRDFPRSISIRPRRSRSQSRRSAPCRTTPRSATSSPPRNSVSVMHARLCDYRDLILPLPIEPPAPWSNLTDFLADLAASLNRLHDPNGHALLFQSLRHGTETTQDLTRSSDAAVRGLFAAFAAPIERYLGQMGQGQDALRRRNGSGWRFNGSWSVRLRNRGFHTSHVHPRGWISSAFYVELPDIMTEGRTDEGVLSFGKPGILTSPSLEAEYSVRPVPGMLVLFPSYFWHGTVPFQSPQPRLTVAFDAVPQR